MSASAHPLNGANALYDFTASQDTAFSLGADPMKEMGNGKFCMFGGDGNGDGFINATDLNLVWRPDNGTSGYKSSDFNMDGFINADDTHIVFHEIGESNKDRSQANQ